MRPIGRILAAAFCLGALAAPAPSHAQGPASDGAPKAKSKARPKAARRDRPGTYMGRPIADVMSWQGAEWLFRETRVEEEQPEAMLDALDIQPGMTVADVGAGVGYHTVRLARRVGEKGLVLATDVQPKMIAMLKDNVRDAGARNVRPLLCTQNDTKLPAGEVDLILLVDVYHECSDPETVLDGMLAALKPGGRLVLVEFRGEDPDVPIKPEHKMTLAQVRREVEPRGFAFKTSHEFLPWQHIIVFEKPEAREGDGGRPETSPATVAGKGPRRRPLTLTPCGRPCQTIHRGPYALGSPRAFACASTSRFWVPRTPRSGPRLNPGRRSSKSTEEYPRHREVQHSEQFPTLSKAGYTYIQSTSCPR